MKKNKLKLPRREKKKKEQSDLCQLDIHLIYELTGIYCEGFHNDFIQMI